MSAFTDQFVSLKFPLMGLVRFPEVTISEEDRIDLKLKPKATNRDVLKQLAWEGFLEREAKGWFKDIPRQRVIDQFKTEFATFDKTGVIPYLLLIWDINRWADKQGIVRGWGRGSAGGSLTNACLGITNVNPLRHNLDFPRFLSEARMKPVIKDGVTYVDGKSAPDIDVDYQYMRRADVVKYVETKYAGRTCKISTRMELTGKMALKDTLKVYVGYTEDRAKVVSDMIEARFGKVQTLHEAKEKNEDIQKWIKANPDNAKVYEIAMAIEGLAIGKGQHPSGVFICYDPLEGNIPVELSKTKDVVTSFDMETVAGLGIKADILGLRTLDLVANTAALAGIKLDDINPDDPIIYDYLKTKDTYIGLFQIEDGVTKEAARKIQPRNITDLATILAISRPGAMKYIDQFALYVKTGEVKPFYPAIDEILKSTGGALIMQEQITQVCRDVFGLSGIDADSVRYACGKKRRDLMEPWEKVLFANGRERGIPENIIQTFWDVCNASADYSFNSSHAFLYSYLTAACVYLKAKAPQAFYLSMLKLASEEPDSISYMNGVISEMRAGGIQLLPPDLIKSEADFTIQDGHVRFGLASIKGISAITMAKVTSFKRDFGNRFEVFEAAKAAKVNINVLTGLIMCGCLDSIVKDGSSRATLALHAQLYNLLTGKNEKTLVKRYASEYHDDLLALLKGIATKRDEKGKPLIKDSRLETLRRDYADYWKVYQANAKNERLTCYLSERFYLGFSFTSSLNEIFNERVVGLLPIKAVLKGVPGNQVKFVAFIGEGKMMVSAKGAQYWRFIAYDDESTATVLLHGDERVEACRSYNGDIPTVGSIVTISASLSKDGKVLFAESVIEQAHPLRAKKVDPKDVDL